MNVLCWLDDPVVVAVSMSIPAFWCQRYGSLSFECGICDVCGWQPALRDWFYLCGLCVSWGGGAQAHSVSD